MLRIFSGAALVIAGIAAFIEAHSHRPEERQVLGDGDERCETILDFVVPTLDEARAYIRDGATNGVELLEDAGMTTAEAEAELRRVAAS